ncbi:MAG: lysophospholipid acyltransferase family protein [Spirochaetota bacterium]
MPSRTPACRRHRRTVLKFLGTVGLKLLSRIGFYGLEKLPDRGPFIIAGNHRAVMEIFLMIIAIRPHIDIIGAGDFPLDPTYRPLALAYGYIPYRRGSVDGRALRRALSILHHGGAVGIFPEGGIWTEGPKDTQRGVAWLAAQSGAPVIPMGFAGIDRGVERVFQFEFPRFEVHVGDPITFDGAGVNRKTLDDFSRRVMAQVDELIPEWDRTMRPVPDRDEYSLRLEWYDSDAPDADHHELTRTDPQATVLSRFYHLPVILSIFRVNLRRDVEAVKAWDEPVRAREFTIALRRILGYLRLHNPYLLTYRFGQEQGKLLERALVELRDWLEERPEALVRVVPVRRIIWDADDPSTVEVRTAPRS